MFEYKLGITGECRIPKEQNILFICGNINMLELKENGDIFVKGELIENDIDVVNGLREFLQFHQK